MKAGSTSLISQVLAGLSQTRTLVLGVLGRSDDPVAKEVERLGYELFRGSESQVISRFHHAALVSDAEWLVRITADNPMTQKSLIPEAVLAIEKGGGDYLCPQGLPLGTGFEVFRRSTFLRLFARPTLPSHWVEHVTPGLYEPGTTAIRVPFEACYQDIAHLRLTVDCELDLELVNLVSTHLALEPSQITLPMLRELYQKNPECFNTNQSVKQKGLFEN
jgi:spore coat polysaccharide biosynthesis protein SpsF (cytidylyltransferase family)